MLSCYAARRKGKKDQGKQQESSAPLRKTQHANSIRHVPSGTYFARFRIKDKLVWRSLRTDRLTIAYARLPDEIEKERTKAENASALAKGKMTGGELTGLHELRRD